jgi:hypothetical protein
MTDCPHPLCHKTLQGGQTVCTGHLDWWRRAQRRRGKAAEQIGKQTKLTLSGSLEDQLVWWWNLQQHQSSQDSDKAPSAMSKKGDFS